MRWQLLLLLTLIPFAQAYVIEINECTTYTIDTNDTEINIYLQTDLNCDSDPLQIVIQSSPNKVYFDLNNHSLSTASVDFSTQISYFYLLNGDVREMNIEDTYYTTVNKVTLSNISISSTAYTSVRESNIIDSGISSTGVYIYDSNVFDCSFWGEEVKLENAQTHGFTRAIGLYWAKLINVKGSITLTGQLVYLKDTNIIAPSSAPTITIYYGGISDHCELNLEGENNIYGNPIALHIHCTAGLRIEANGETYIPTILSENLTGYKSISEISIMYTPWIECSGTGHMYIDYCGDSDVFVLKDGKNCSTIVQIPNILQNNATTVFTLPKIIAPYGNTTNVYFANGLATLVPPTTFAQLVST